MAMIHSKSELRKWEGAPKEVEVGHELNGLHGYIIIMLV